MKNFRIILSVVLVLVIASMSVIPAFAQNVLTENRNVLSEDLKEVMQSSSNDEKIKVYLWYKDINQNEVDTLTTKATGLTRESCEVIEEFPSLELITSFRNGDKSAKIQMEDYIERTKKSRDKEREKTEIYAQKHMEISNAKYNQKSQSLRKELSISDTDIEFSSQFAPMIIAEMTKEELEKAARNENIDEISLYIEQEPVEESISSAIQTTNIDKIISSDYLGLTGEDVKIGIIENGRVILSTDGEEELSILIANERKNGKEVDLDTLVRFDVGQTTPITITTNTGGTISDYGNLAIVDGISLPKSEHATYVSKTLLSVAPNAKIYSTDHNHERIETLISAGVKLFNVSIGSSVLETSDKYAYTDEEKWYDYLVANHGITVFKSAGNNGEHPTDYTYVKDNETVQGYGARVTTPGMAYNVITVGAYWDALDVASPNEPNQFTDTLFSYSSYKNAVGDKIGCEKPDVVMPSTFNGGGTSMASPFLAGVVALMYELKPSLASSPHIVKSIVLASCHRKVTQYTEHTEENFITGEQETMAQGITERQGAGAPDAWAMASIVCQGTYGYGLFVGTDTKINIVQPPYGAENMNISVVWVRENTLDNTSNSNSGSVSDVVPATLYNLDLEVVTSVGTAKSSTLTCSSTEMCYLPLSTTDFRYQIRLTNNTSTTASVKYAYAWSTDNMRAAPISDEGVYYIKNVDNEKYITYTETNGTPQVTLSEISATSVDNSAHQWVIEGMNFIPGCTTEKLYLARSSTAIGTSRLASLDDEEQEWYPIYNDDGTVSYVNASFNRILSYNGDNVVWDSFSITSTPTSAQKWHLEKNNYIVADANADGAFSEAEDSPNLDARFIQRYLQGSVTPTNVQLFLSDANRDGVIDIFDATWVQAICEGSVIY